VVSEISEKFETNMRVVCLNDSKSLYDLIGRTQAAIATRRMGVPKVSVDCLFMTSQEATHRVHRAYGDSHKVPIVEIPMRHLFMGYVKVTKSAKAIWVSNGQLPPTRHTEEPISKRKVKFVGYAFVEDTDLMQTLREAYLLLLSPRKHTCIW